MSPLRRFLPAWTLAFAIAALYLYNLAGVGVLGPDEPRYAAIGRAMASTGDWITPRLWGAPWFEKPPLVYWSTAIATSLGLGPETSARLPIAVLSLAFLAAFFLLLKREFGARAAAFSAVILATSAGWLAYSQLCLTDVPLAIFFSFAVLLALPLTERQDRTTLRLALIGVSVGIAVLAKGLVPIVLAVPFFWHLRPHWRKWWIAIAAMLLISLPWYAAVYLKNGQPFIEEFFIRHHFERLYSASLQHVRPWYFYVPVLLGSLFPWTGLIALPFTRPRDRDRRTTFLISIVVFGLVFFSISLNKLPGYILPLLPSLGIVIGTRAATVREKGPWYIACAILIATIPLAAATLPRSLEAGRFTWSTMALSKPAIFYIALPVIALILARRSWAPVLLALCVVAAGLYMKTVDYPILDEHASARGLWLRVQPFSNQLCDAGANRDWIYGLSFYRGSFIGYCKGQIPRIELRPHGHGEPDVVQVP